MHPQDWAECKDQITTYGSIGLFSLITLFSITGLIIYHTKLEWIKSLVKNSPQGESAFCGAVYLGTILSLGAIVAILGRLCFYIIQKDDCCRGYTNTEKPTVPNGTLNDASNKNTKLQNVEVGATTSQSRQS
ncbi:hypothetical protein [Candidatus Mesenet endosymbiont of Agriotes lineatus]|uniref:hypothetical protein n=1 Tax=Candidatus Mesenet endosymbiont of Agriotes lineatus TaxID=3077948 RepID=UPI0030D12F65